MRTKRKYGLRTAILIAVFAMIAAACGGDGEPSADGTGGGGGDGGQEVTLLHGISGEDEQAALQQANFTRDLAMQRIDAQMSLEGVDWSRYQSDPGYRQEVVSFFAMKQETMLGIAQAGAAGQAVDNAGLEE